MSLENLMELHQYLVERTTPTKHIKTVEKLITRPNDAKWISVEDELPKEEGYYLVAFNYGSGQMPCAVNPTRYWNGTNFVTMATVKHWMPLPEPPKQSSEGEEGQ